MKAGSLWPGTDYAYYEYRGRGRPLPLNAKRVKVLELQKQPVYGGKRDRTLALVAFLDDEGAAITEGLESTPRTVRAADIIDFWEQYEEDRTPLLEEQERKDRELEERQAQYRREREERHAIESVAIFIRNAAYAMQRYEAERIMRERQEKQEKHFRRIKNVLITRGIKNDQIFISEYYVQINLQEIERWLGIDSESA